MMNDENVDCMTCLLHWLQSCVAMTSKETKMCDCGLFSILLTFKIIIIN